MRRKKERSKQGKTNKAKQHSTCTCIQLNNGHSGDRPLVHCREVVPISEVMPYIHVTINYNYRLGQAVCLFYGGCLLLRMYTI